MSDNTQDQGLADAMNSIRSIGEDWESRDPRPPEPANTDDTSADDTKDDETKEDDHV